jgi:hypothetical protein
MRVAIGILVLVRVYQQVLAVIIVHKFHVKKLIVIGQGRGIVVMPIVIQIADGIRLL